MSAKKWFSTGYLKAAPAGKVDYEKGIIEGVSVCTAGEAKGHGISLDNEFIGRVVEFGNAKKQGLKARFGHPNMCSTALGTFIGRFKNFRADADGAQARADLFLSNEAKETPNGDLFSYVMGLAKNEPDMFGTSIVFTPGRIYKKDEKGQKIYAPGWEAEESETGEEYRARRDAYQNTAGPEYVECDELHACDAVDDPAANEGLFSKFSQETVAGQLTEFLDLHPQIWKAVSDNPEIIRVLASYGEKIDEFTAKYRDYLKNNPDGKKTMSDTKEEIAPAADAPKKEAEEVAKPEGEANPTGEVKADETPKGDEAKTDEAKPGEQAPAKQDEQPPATQAEAQAEPASELKRMVDAFGQDIAVSVFTRKGTFAEAEQEYYAKLRDDNKKLTAEVAELRKQLGENAGVMPAAFSATPTKQAPTLEEICTTGTKKK